MDDLQVIAEPTRRTILGMLCASDGSPQDGSVGGVSMGDGSHGELSAGEIADYFPTTFGAVSQHLAVLREAGFVSVRVEGNRRFYRTVEDRVGPYRQVLEPMWAEVLDDLVATIEGTQLHDAVASGVPVSTEDRSPEDRSRDARSRDARSPEDMSPEEQR